MTAPPRTALRVLHVDRSVAWGGGQNQVRLLLAGVPPDVRAVAGLFTVRGSRLAAESRVLDVRTVEHPWRSPLGPAPVRALAALLAGPWEVVQAHDAHALQAALVARAAAGRDLPVVAARRVSGAPRTPAIWRRADLVLGVSDAACRSLLQAGIAADRIRRVPDGIDLADLAPPRPGRLRSAARVGDRTAFVAAIGALAPAKGHDTFLGAAALVASHRPEARFAVFGEGPLRSRLERRVRRLGLQDRFALPGAVPDAARSLGDLDLFVMPSRTEGLGTAALEAMAAGRPVILTDGGGLVELAGDAIPTVPAGSPEALAAEILRLLEDPVARRARAEAGLARARTFTVGQMVRRTVAAWRDVNERARRRAAGGA
ncbi:MAG: glycosyltransferase [Gemmatimonadota bacterium]|nr:glycosyltransferase [Gemmatimonadota bacterium]